MSTNLYYTRAYELLYTVFSSTCSANTYHHHRSIECNWSKKRSDEDEQQQKKIEEADEENKNEDMRRYGVVFHTVLCDYKRQ